MEDCYHCITWTCCDSLDSHRIARFILAHAVLLSFPGVPAVYIQSILGSRNDYAGVERQVGRLSRVAVGVERQPALENQQQHAPEEPEEVDHQQRLEKLFPVHLLRGVDTAHAVDEPFDRSHEVEPRALTSVYFGNVASQRIT